MDLTPKPYDHRITVRVLRAGQRAAYADSETHTVIVSESVNYGSNEFTPWPITEREAMAAARAAPCGFISRRKDEREHGLESYLDSFLPRHPERRDSFGAPSETAELRSWIWDFVTVSPFTD